MTLTTDGAPATATTGADAPAAPEVELTAWGARLDQAVAGIQALPAEERAVAEEFALALDSLSRTALTTIVRRLRSDDRGKELLFELVDDPAVRLLLGMHGIIRMPDPAQADRVRSGTGEDGSAAPSHGAPTGSASGSAPRAFFSLESLFRGPQSSHACGCGGAEGAACVCGAH